MQQDPVVEQDSPQRRRERREDELGSLSGRVIGAAIAVHRQLGPGLLESAYEECLGFELAWNGIAYDRQVPLPLEYRGHRLDCGYRIDLVVERQLIIELKTVEQVLPIHEAQVLTYLRLTRLPLALLINFNVVLLKQGLRRFVLADLAFSASSGPPGLAEGQPADMLCGEFPSRLPPLAPNPPTRYKTGMFCGLRLACRTARAVARGSACLLAIGLLLRLSRP